jgi:hypothetical protein
VYFIALASNAELPELPVSVMEAGLPAESSTRDVLLAPGRFQVYFRGEDEGFTEERSSTVNYAIGASSREYVLRFTSSTSAVVALRIDPADRVLAWTMDALEIADSEGRIAWRWDGSVAALMRASECFFVSGIPDARPAKGTSGVEVICLGGDPNFQVDIDAETGARLATGFEVRVRFAARRLLPGYQLDFRRALGDLAGLRHDLRTLRQTNAETLVQLSNELRSAHHRARAVEEELAQARAEAGSARQALASLESSWHRLRSRRSWRLINRLLRLDAD